MIKPISPREVDEIYNRQIPEKIILTVNDAIMEHYKGHTVTKVEINYLKTHMLWENVTQEAMERYIKLIPIVYSKYGWGINVSATHIEFLV